LSKISTEQEVAIALHQEEFASAVNNAFQRRAHLLRERRVVVIANPSVD